MLWPELAHRIVSVLRRTMLGAAEFAADVVFQVARNGHEEALFLTISTSPIVQDDGPIGGVFCTFADTTAQVEVARARPQEALAAADADARYRTFFTQGSHFAMLLNRAGMVIEVNLVTLEASGYRRDQVVGRDVWDCPGWAGAPDAVRALHDATAQALAGQAAHRRLPYVTAGGEERIGQLALAPVCDDTGRLIYLAATGTDITEREGVEARLRLLDAIGETTRVALAPDAILDGATRLLGDYL